MVISVKDALDMIGEIKMRKIFRKSSLIALSSLALIFSVGFTGVSAATPEGAGNAQTASSTSDFKTALQSADLNKPGIQKISVGENAYIEVGVQSSKVKKLTSAFSAESAGIQTDNVVADEAYSAYSVEQVYVVRGYQAGQEV